MLIISQIWDYQKIAISNVQALALRVIAEATEQLRQGEVIEGELVFQQLQEKLK